MNHVEQNLTNKIVALLLKEDLHTRAIAERHASNHPFPVTKGNEAPHNTIFE